MQRCPHPRRTHPPPQPPAHIPELVEYDGVFCGNRFGLGLECLTYGLPGIPLALCMPASQFVLLDSNGNKIRFVEHVAAAMGLDNVVPVQVRAEAYSADPLFDSIVSRAYSSLHDFVTSSGRLVAEGGQLVAMKGKHPQAELAAVPDNWQVTRLEKLSVPEVDADRHIVVLQRA